ADQPARRPVLHGAGSEDPLLMARRANRSVLLGGAILAVVVAVGLLAPVLATSDPSVIDPAARNRKPGAERTVRGDDGRPRAVRLVRALVLSIREEPYVEAAVALGARTPALLRRHVVPNTLAPLIVQATFVCASAILIEAILSFLGVGIPPETPTWGNIMAEGRALFRVFPHNILFPGIFLAATVLAVNMLGDGLRDQLDPRVSRRL